MAEAPERRPLPAAKGFRQDDCGEGTRNAAVTNLIEGGEAPPESLPVAEATARIRRVLRTVTGRLWSVTTFFVSVEHRRTGPPWLRVRAPRGRPMIGAGLGKDAFQSADGKVTTERAEVAA